MASEGTDSKCEGRENPDLSEDTGVSMVDVLEEETKLEEDANAVLGDSDDKNCTYLMGYIPRQALYSCTTCVPADKDPAAICLACCYECHEGHDLIELYTKRNVRCDCGNQRFADLQCKLCPNKKARNEDNSYNQNYKGQYCICHRPYPDPDDSIEDEMIQCLVCEDWFHGRHLGGKVPVNGEFEEVTCQTCMEKHPFLWFYALPSTDVEKRLTRAKTDETVDVEGGENKPSLVSADEAKDSLAPPTSTARVSKVAETESDGISVKQETQSNGNDHAARELSSGLSEPAGQCLLADLQKGSVTSRKGAAFWQQGWRAKLCGCQSCKDMYNRDKVSFLIDQSDTVHAYEQRGKAKQGTSSGYDQGLQVLSSMNRVQQVEVIQGYNDMKTELSDYLKKFVDNGKVVREEDIREFFETMEARKKQRTATTAMQWTCK